MKQSGTHLAAALTALTILFLPATTASALEPSSANGAERASPASEDSACGAAPNATLAWTRLPNLPDDEGFAGPFAGVVEGKLVVAGGANFPDARPWEGGTKIWYDAVFLLDRPDGTWRKAGKLPRPLAYGISVTTSDGVVCIGGGDAQRHYADCFLLRMDAGTVTTSRLPSLPRPCAYACGVLLDNTIYVAGGIQRPDDTRAMHAFWALDLGARQRRWVQREPWPGPERLLATAGAQDGALFLFGGTALDEGPDGKPMRRMLLDAYRFGPGKGWRRVADLPRPTVAAPSPAPAIGQSRLLVLGGDDGSQLDNPPQTHRGFPRDVLAYHTTTDTWDRRWKVPFSLVTTTVVRWNHKIIIPGGEARPGIRSTDVWSGAVVSD